MSDAGKDQREWRFYLDDMLKFARNVQTYTGWRHDLEHYSGRYTGIDIRSGSS
jgi:uncharacterized protein with HEPN domain